MTPEISQEISQEIRQLSEQWQWGLATCTNLQRAAAFQSKTR